MSKLRNVLLYVVCGVLAVFYLFVFYLGMNPDVPLEYEMYYFTHELTEWPGYDNLDYELGSVEYCMNGYDEDGNYDNALRYLRRGDGWDWPELKGMKNHPDKNEAFMYYVPVETKDNVTLNLNVTEYEGVHDTKVYAGDICIGSFDSAGEHKFVIPEWNKEELVVITLKTEGVKFRVYTIMIS